MVEVYKILGAWVVAENDVWVDGVYTSEEAARYAVDIDIMVLARINKEHDYSKGEITLEELKNKSDHAMFD